TVDADHYPGGTSGTEIIAAEEPATTADSGVELVLGVQREVVRHRDAADGTERQGFRIVVSRGVGNLGRNQCQVTDRLAADAHGSAGVGIDQSGRYAQELDVVVKTFTSRLTRHDRHDVAGIKVQEVTNGVAVFLAVQTRNAFAARIRICRVFEVQGHAEVTGEGVQHGARRTWFPGGRHHAGAHL